jgi:hypothetical protein
MAHCVAAVTSGFEPLGRSRLSASSSIACCVRREGVELVGTRSGLARD